MDPRDKRFLGDEIGSTARPDNWPLVWPAEQRSHEMALIGLTRWEGLRSEMDMNLHEFEHGNHPVTFDEPMGFHASSWGSMVLDVTGELQKDSFSS
jgi:hypothetical protein